MCLILIAWHAHPGYRLIIAANRDEWRARPTTSLDYWKTEPVILAGRDLQAGGGWFGCGENGRIAAVTNLRDGRQQSNKPRSRGQLVTDFLLQDTAAESWFCNIDRQRNQYNGFNLLAGDQNGLWRYCSADSSIVPLDDGVHCISNGLPTTQWPKTERSKKLLTNVLKNEQPEPSSLLSILHDRWQPADPQLPDTGVDLELERQLAPIFIQGKEYGTRCSSLLLVEAGGHWTFLERSFDHGVPKDRQFQGQYDC